MRFKLNILQKILVYILGSSVLLFAIIFLYVSNSNRSNIQETSLRLTDSYAQRYAYDVQQWIGDIFVTTRTLGAAYREYRNMPFEEWMPLFRSMNSHAMRVSPNIDAIWDSWMANRVNPNWDGPQTARYFSNTIRNASGRLTINTHIDGMNGESTAFAAVRTKSHEFMLEPYFSKAQQVLMSSVIIPIMDDGFVGLVASDIKLSQFQTQVENIRPFPNSQAFIITHHGYVVAHSDTSLARRNISETFIELPANIDYMAKVQSGIPFSFTFDHKHKRSYCTVMPVKLGTSNEYWAVGITTPYSDVLARSNRDYNRALLVALLSILAIIAVVIAVGYSITNPLKEITHRMQSLAKGKVTRDLLFTVTRNDEIGLMTVAFSEAILGILEKTDFAQHMGKGDLDAEITLLSSDDTLGKALVEMRDSLRSNRNEEEERKADEAKRRWISEGLAEFGGIMRRHNDNLELLCDDVVKNLVWYLKASVGGIFMADENPDDPKRPSYSLISAFAYDRKRIFNKKYEHSEGLVGACAAERDIIVLTEIPDNYIEITSGLGDANPNSIILAPLVNDNDEVLGVIEVASLQRFETHEIEFVKEMCKSITSSLNTVRVNALTKQLFEQSQAQAERMQEQEEEMRQNFEELQATQEEAARKSYELEGIVSALNSSFYMVEYDVSGFVISVNDAFLRTLCAKREDILGTHHIENTNLSDMARASYEQFWNEILEGQIKTRKTHIKMEGINRVLLETYSGIRNEQGEIYKVLKISTDVTNV